MTDLLACGCPPMADADHAPDCDRNHWPHDACEPRTAHNLHPVSDPSVVWYGGMGHRLISGDEGSVQCFRCADTFDADAWQECVADCDGPDRDDDPHYWIGAHRSADGAEFNECAICGARTAVYA